jgi:hypothetical protein
MARKPDRKRPLLRTKGMSDTEDYPGPTHQHPDKEGQDPRGRADEDMVKPPARPEAEKKEDKDLPDGRSNVPGKPRRW